MLFRYSAALFAAAAGLVSGQNHVSNKNTAFSGLSFNEDGLKAALTPPSSSYTKWAWGTLPEFCYKSSIPTNGLSNLIHCNPYDIEVYDVKYSDCSSPWTFCRCNNASWPLNTAIDIIGRVPVKARQYTRTWAQYTSIAGAEAGTWAYSLGIDTAIFDSGTGGARPSLMLHENAHTIDIGWRQMHGAGGWVSSTDGWVNAINADTCVPDSYAKSNDVEDFAQVTVSASYDKNVGPLSRYGSVGCMQNQLNFVESTITETLTKGGTCDFYWAKDNVVCMGPAAGCGNQGQVVQSNALLSSAKFADAGKRLVETPKLLVTEVEESENGTEFKLKAREVQGNFIF